MTSPHDIGMTWEGRRCGGFLTTQNQGQLGNLLNQTQKQINQAKQIHSSSKSKRNQGFVLESSRLFTIQKARNFKNSRSKLPKLVS